MSESINAFRSVQRRQVCLHPEASGTECRGGIVQAHTVQMNLLRKIARDGHVYGFPLDYGAIVSSQGVPRPRLMGIGQASTFTGFCAKHDDQLFADIEKSPIRATGRHAWLLAYRALCRELFAKEGGVLLDPYRRTLDRGRSVLEQIALQEQTADLMTGTSAGLEELRALRRRYDRMLADGDYSSVKYCVVWLQHPPDMMCSGCTNPDWDYSGRKLQDLSDLSVPMHDIMLSLLASEERGCAFFSWLVEEERVCAQLIGSLLSLPRDRIPDAIVRFVVSNFENQFWRPDWWESLGAQNQEALKQRFLLGVHPLIPISPDYLCDDGVRLVDWRITCVETNAGPLTDLAQALGVALW